MLPIPGDFDNETEILSTLGLQSYLLRRWDWDGCQEGLVIPNLRRYDEVGVGQ